MNTSLGKNSNLSNPNVISTNSKTTPENNKLSLG